MEEKGWTVQKEAPLNDGLNLLIWDQVDTSTPEQLKKVNYGRSFMSIDAYPQLKKATQVFGPMGIGFGLDKNPKVTIIDTTSGKKSDKNKPVQYMMIESTFWYKFPGTSLYGHFPVINGLIFDGSSESSKKILTNSISKALSYLGFNYDVFCGSWDDDPYTDRPDIPCPEWVLNQWKQLLASEAFDEESKKKLTQFQIDAGWTLQSVQNFIKAAPDVIRKRGFDVPSLTSEGDYNGVHEIGEDGETSETSEEKASESEERA